MVKQQTWQRSLVTVARLGLVAFVGCGFALTTYIVANNTSSSLNSETTVLVSEATQPQTEGSVQVSVPEKVTVVVPTGATRFDKAIDVLPIADAHLYRTIFAAQKEGNWAEADAAIASLSDRRLIPAIEADRLERRGGTREAMAAWLRANADWAEAETLHALARHTARSPQERKASAKPSPLRAPTVGDVWSGGGVMDSAADFKVDLKESSGGDTATTRLAAAMTRALHRGNPQKAVDLLVKAQADRTLFGTFAADAAAAVAASFYYEGERDKALSLATAAAGAQQPVGLWIRGLIAWERDDLPSAVASFTRLAAHPALTPASRAAAQFWAWRALSRSGNVRDGRAMLEAAARQTGSFYGILAAVKLGRHPITQTTNPGTLPRWDREQRAVLVDRPAGWRALAYIQVGEVARAENELRHLNPQGQGDLQQAMIALANFVPMPSLVVQLASLAPPSDTQIFDDAAYPVPPWAPRQGFEVDRALVFALVRHESLFDPHAVSAQGARGLMQIMPATARGMAEGRIDKASFSLDDTNKLLDPATNLALGQRYVRHLASQPAIGNNLLLLLAAYNSGPAKLTRWFADAKARLPQGHADDPLLFLESLPARETRGYITRVMTHYWAYCARLDKPLSSLRQLAAGEWPRFDLSDKPRKKEASAEKTDAYRLAALTEAE